MRDKTTIIVTKDNGFHRVFCNDPSVEVLWIETLGEPCGVCGNYHRKEFTGDCRDDNERFTEVGD